MIVRYIAFVVMICLKRCVLPSNDRVVSDEGSRKKYDEDVPFTTSITLSSSGLHKTPMLTTTRPQYSTGTENGSFASQACHKVKGLTRKQKSVCVESPSLIPVLVMGIEKSIVECGRQMSRRRWNCTTFDMNVVFGKRPKSQLPGNKERAFIHAIANAGVVSEVALSCHVGNISSCGGCGPSSFMLSNDAYTQGSCSADVWNSGKFAKRMMDGRENSYTPLSALNLHSNEIGRQTVVEAAGKHCRCHGISASCSVQTCFQAFPSLEKVGRRLRDKYDNALYAVTTRTRTGAIKLREINPPTKRRATRKETNTGTPLLYIKDSPSYCDHNPGIGSMGTHGRRCFVGQNNKWENCDFLCCGRGFRTEVKEIVHQCNCVFTFCCRMECQNCTVYESKHYCL